MRQEYESQKEQYENNMRKGENPVTILETIMIRLDYSNETIKEICGTNETTINKLRNKLGMPNKRAKNYLKRMEL